jgi:hypothetical protein
MLICSAHGTVIDREHRECREKLVSGCIMCGRGGHAFSDFELEYLEAAESWRTRLLEDPAPLTHEERDAIADFLVNGIQDFLCTGPHADLLPGENDEV